MRDRRRHLAGFSVAALLALAAIARRCARGTGLADGVPSLASPSQKPFIAPKPRADRTAAGRPTTPTPTATPTRSPRRRARPPARSHFCVHWVAEGLDAPKPRPTPTTRRHPRLRREGAGGRRTRPRGRERASSAGASRRATGARAAAGARPTSTSRRSAASCSATPPPTAARPTKEHRLPRRLHGYLVLDNDYSPFEFPGTKPIQDLQVTFAHEYNHILQFGYDAFQDPWFAESTATWMEDQVYNGIDDYLRYVRPLGEPLRHAADHQLDQGVRLGRLEPVAGAPLRRARSSARPGRGRCHPARRLLGRRLRPRDPRAPAAPTSAATSPASPPPSPSGGPERGFRESELLPRHAAPGQPAARRRGTLTARSTTPPSSCCGSTPRGGRAVVVHVDAPARRSPPGLALVGRIGSERRRPAVTRLDYQRNGGSCACGSPTRAASAGSPRSLVNADAQRRRLQRPPARLALPDRPVPFEIGGDVRWRSER